MNNTKITLRQVSVATSFAAQQEHSDVVYVKDFVRICLQAKIRLEKTPKLADFHNNCSQRGQALPSVTLLLRNYVPIFAGGLRSKTSSICDEAKAKKSICTINIDETTDH